MGGDLNCSVNSRAIQHSNHVKYLFFPQKIKVICYFLIPIFPLNNTLFKTFLTQFFHLSNFRVIVGAPEDDSEQAKVGIEKAGAVYRCQTQMPFRCDQIPFDTSGKNS